MSRASRLLGLAGGVLLLVATVHHGSGYGAVSAVASEGSLGPWLVRSVGGLWLFVSWHFLVIALASLGSVARPGPWSRPALWFCGVVTLGDFFWVFALAGWFLGTAELLGAALCLLGGAWRTGAGGAPGERSRAGFGLP